MVIVKVYYENSCGSYVFAKDEEEVKKVLSDLYEINDSDWDIEEVDIIKKGYYVGKNIYHNDYSFGDIVNEFKNFNDNGSYFYEFRVTKSKYGFKIWKSFKDILQELQVNNDDEPIELFSLED